MSKLEELIQEYCPEGVAYKNLEDCCTVLDKKRKPVTKAVRESGEYPYYGANGIQDYVANYIFDGTFILVGEDGSVITPTGKPVVNWAEGKIWVNNHAHIVAEKEGVLLRFLYHFIQTVDVTTYIHGNIPKFTGRDFKTVQIPVPPLPVQEEIVRILDTFTALTAELQDKLQAELQARKKQYEYYKLELLNFDEKVKRVSLGELCKVSAGGDAPKNSISKIKTDEYKIPIISNGIGENAFYGYTNFPKITTPAVTISARGTIGYAEYRNYPYYPIIRLLTAIPNDVNVLDAKYLFYCLQGKTYSVPLGGIPQLTAPELKKVLIALPSMSAQKRIVGILDKFSSLCNSLTSGLPAEISARQKQYEYYRDRLLSFTPSKDKKTSCL